MTSKTSNVRFTVGQYGWEVWNKHGECLGEVENVGPKAWVIHTSGKILPEVFPTRKEAGEFLVRKNVSFRDLF